MKTASMLKTDELIEIVDVIQGILCISVTDNGTEYWDPDKECCVDSTSDIYEALNEFGLIPKEREKI